MANPIKPEMNTDDGTDDSLSLSELDSLSGGVILRGHLIRHKVKSLESDDKLGNFEIQDLMSTYNQA